MRRTLKPSVNQSRIDGLCNLCPVVGKLPITKEITADALLLTTTGPMEQAKNRRMRIKSAAPAVFSTGRKPEGLSTKGPREKSGQSGKGLYADWLRYASASRGNNIIDRCKKWWTLWSSTCFEPESKSGIGCEWMSGFRGWNAKGT